jgi:hypothetical protein
MVSSERLQITIKTLIFRQLSQLQIDVNFLNHLGSGKTSLSVAAVLNWEAMDSQGGA